jgi:RNA recognition motif-containing protein
MNNYQLTISGLSWDTTERELRTLFSIIGKVEDVTLIINGTTGESIGEAFVSMSEKTEAENAEKILDRKVVDGKEIRVEMASRDDKSFKKAILSNA